MNALTIIDALCSMGNTEGCGRFATPFKDGITDFMQDMFGGGHKIEIMGDILENYNYVYSYDDTLGKNIADAIIQVYDEKINVIAEVFLYEIDE